MKQILVSIIIPTYNRADFIGKTIKSVLNQTYSNFEIIIVDDGSTDNTKEVVRSFADSRISYFKKQNEERAVARNYGIEKAKGDFITFLDSDDVFLDFHLAEAVNFIKAHINDLKIFFQPYYLLLEGQRKNKIPQKIIPIAKSLIKKGNFMACQGVFLKNEVARNNSFNEDRLLSGSEDYELWLRISRKFKIEYNPVYSSILIDHQGRSQHYEDTGLLILRKELFLKYTLAHGYSKPEFRVISSGAYSYIALHLSLQSDNTAWSWLLKAIDCDLRILLTKRTFVTIKNLFLAKSSVIKGA